MEIQYASNGKGNLGVTLGAIGTGLAVLGGQNGNLLGGLMGGVQLRDANVYTDSKLNDLRNYVDNKFAVVNDKLCAQAVHNATNDAVLGCMQNQIAQLMGLTKLVVPNASICPGWGNVTVTPAAAPTTGG